MTLTQRLALITALSTPMAPLAQAEQAPGQLIADRFFMEPYLYPKIGGASYRGSEMSGYMSQTGVGLGQLIHDLRGEVFSGQARLEGSLLRGDGSGYEGRAGILWTPRQKYWGAKMGFDLLYNVFNSETIGLPATFGVEFPMQVILGPKSFHGIAGISPAWLSNSARHTTWDDPDTFGFGHEFAWSLGGGVTVGRFTVSITYTQRTNILGTADGVTVGFGQAPYNPPELED